ncbi:MAG: dual specificity phosphatase [Rhodospirillales bacterium]|jgi:protein-tyrosine phosphatase|nr:dual specificity phosphatase [Rhodospirillales bacterium]
MADTKAGSQTPQSSSDDAGRDAMRAAAKRIDKVNDWLHLGGAVPPDQYERLAQAGVTHVVDLRETHEHEPDIGRLDTLGIARYNAPIANFTAPTADQLGEIARWLDTNMPTGAVYVHCQGGFGRAATIAAGLLMLRGRTADEAVQELRNVRPEIRINEVQMTWLRMIETETPPGGSR